MIARIPWGLAMVVLGLVVVGAAVLIGPVPWGDLDHALFLLRIVRLGSGLVAGAALAVAGVLMQGLLRNPLAGPSLTGVTAGASLAGQAMVIVIAVGQGHLPWLRLLPEDAWLALAALIGAGSALALLLALCRGQRGDPATVILVGLILSILFAAAGAYLLARGSDALGLGRALITFSLGGLDDATGLTLVVATPLVLAGLVAAWLWSGSLDIMMTGEVEARALGLEIHRARRWVLVWIAVLTAAAVTLCGAVGFIGLVVPNALRAALGPRHRPLVAWAVVAGGTMVVGCDAIARLLQGPGGPMPLGVVTGLIGAPFFLWFFRRQRERGWS